MTVESSELKVVMAAKAGDQDSFEGLMRTYRRMVLRVASRYYLKGGERVDLVQEGFIGLWDAVRDYKPIRGSFGTFAEICVHRAIIDAVKTADRQKHRHLNEAVVVKTSMEGDPYDILEELTDQRSCSAEQVYLTNSQGEAICTGLKRRMSDTEARTLKLFYNGQSYADIGQQLGKTAKTADNALFRIKRKLELQIALSN